MLQPTRTMIDYHQEAPQVYVSYVDSFTSAVTKRISDDVSIAVDGDGELLGIELHNLDAHTLTIARNAAAYMGASFPAELKGP